MVPYKFFELFTEIIGWIKIALSPTLLGIFLGFITYYYLPNLMGLILWILISISGLIIGIIWATKKFKTTGTVHFLSRVMATPELDDLKNPKEEEGKKNNKLS